MNPPPDAPPPDGSAGDALQFDQVEPAGADPTDATGSVVCIGCRRAIDSYFELNGKIVCDGCRAVILHQLDGPLGWRRGAVIALWGAGAAAIGSVLYFTVRAVTGYELGLIAIVVGYLVGATVRKRSGGRGGWKMQALAISLTYLSIVSTNVPLIVQAMVKQIQSNQAAAVKAPAAPPGGASIAASLVLIVGFIAGLAMVAPFLSGFDNIMGIVIIGIALYEAWKLYKRVPIGVSGPVRVAISPPNPAGAASAV